MSQLSFRYKARNRQGKLVKGIIESNSLLEAKKALLERQLAVLSVAPASGDILSAATKILKDALQPGISLEELIVFNRQLQTSYSVGLSILQGLELISEQTQSEALKVVIQDVIAEISQGRALHEAFARHPKFFDPIYVNAIKAGEASGQLDDVLSMLSYFAEQRMENQSKIKNATFYPKIVLLGILVVIVVVVTFVIPKFRSFYDKFGGQLPPVTLVVLGISDFFINFWYLILIFGAGAYYGAKRYLDSPKGRLNWHRLSLKLPIFGPIILQADLLTFATVLHLLVKSGIPIVESMGIVRDSISNQVIKDEVEVCRGAIEEGRDISHGFKQSKVFPKMVGNLLSVGEAGGKIEDVLAKIGDYYRVQLAYRLNNLAKAIEPAFLVLIFGVVLVLVLAIFMPIWKMSQMMRIR